jgi:uncharacterized protein (DUF4415 family)
MHTTTLKHGETPTAEQLQRIEAASALPIVADDDCPVYTAEQLRELYINSRTPDVTVTLHLAQDVYHWYCDNSDDCEERINTALRREMAVA